MKVQSKMVFLALAILLPACASIHPGKMGKINDEEKDAAVLISAQKQSDASDEHYSFVTFTLENKTDQIVRIVETEINFAPAIAKRTNILVGQDLGTWIESFKEEQERKKHNRKIGQIAMIIGGAVLGIAGNVTDNTALKVMGAGTMVGGSAWSINDSISNSVSNAQNAKKVPETHIYAPFSIPAGKYLRRWMVIQGAKDIEIKTVILKVVYENHVEKTYAFDL